jgi:hypothetical protein
MDRAALRHQMAEVVREAQQTLRDNAQAPRLWGQVTDLCETIERDSAGASQRLTICTALREDIRAGARNTTDLVEEIVWFVRAVEHDIEDEERDVLLDDVVTRDQTDG